MIVCARCSSSFEPTTSYQIYCSPECRIQATKEKAKERSRAAVIKRRRKSKRMCANDCGTALSVYNDSKICSRCKINDRLVNLTMEDIKEFFDYEQR